MTKAQMRARIARYITEHPEKTYQQIADTVGCSQPTIAKIAVEFGVRRLNGVTAAGVAKLDASK